MRRIQDVPDDPIEPLAVWRDHILNDSVKKSKVICFGVLNDLTKQQGCLHQLCDVMSATPTERLTLLAGYKFLQKSVRNRDAHAYVPKVRQRQFAIVDTLFVESFNLLLQWLPERPTDPT